MTNDLNLQDPFVPVATVLDLQFRQLEHDKRYHKDIFVLSPKETMVHMTMHMAKYLGQLYGIAPWTDGWTNAQAYASTRKTYVDTLIIVMSCANALHIDLHAKTQAILADGIPCNIDALTQAFARSHHVDHLNRVAGHYVQSVGKLAKALEALDHIEDFPSRKTMEEEVFFIWQIAIQAVGVLDKQRLEPNPSVAQAISERLTAVEKRNHHWERLGLYNNDFVPTKK